MGDEALETGPGGLGPCGGISKSGGISRRQSLSCGFPCVD